MENQKIKYYGNVQDEYKIFLEMYDKIRASLESKNITDANISGLIHEFINVKNEISQ